MNIILGALAGIPTIKLFTFFDSEVVVIIRKKAAICSVIHIRDIRNIRLHTELMIEHNEVFGACGFIPCSFLHSAMVEDILTQPFLSHRSISHNDRRQLQEVANNYNAAFSEIAGAPKRRNRRHGGFVQDYGVKLSLPQSLAQIGLRKCGTNNLGAHNCLLFELLHFLFKLIELPEDFDQLLFCIFFFLNERININRGHFSFYGCKQLGELIKEVRRPFGSWLVQEVAAK